MKAREHHSEQDKPRPRSWRKPAIVGLVILAVWTTSRFIPILEWWPQVMAWVHDLGPLGPPVFVLMHVVATICFVPAIVFGMGAAFVYGFWEAFLITLVSTTISAMVVFVISRYMARGWVARKTAGNPKYAAIDDAVGRHGWKIVLLVRLSPGFPFTLVNYALGVTKVSAASFFFATAVGMAPRTLLHVYAGIFGSSLATIGVDGAGPAAVRIVSVAVGVFVTILATIYITRVIRKAVDEEAPEQEEAPQAAEMAVQPAD